MTNFSDFLGLLIVGFFITFFLHQTIGGILGLFWRSQQKKHVIEIVNTWNKP